MIRGDICLADVPFTDGSTAKNRPVLVISQHEFNKTLDFVVLPITSEPDAGDRYLEVIEVSSPYFKKSGLKKKSGIKWSKPLTMHKTCLTANLGNLPTDLVEQIVRKTISVIA
jgi:mRNA interferase MazF